MPVVAGNALPIEGPDFPVANDQMKIVFRTGVSQKLIRSSGCISCYYAVKNSNAVVVGVLELLLNDGNRVDI